MSIRQSMSFYLRLGDLLRGGASLRRALEAVSGSSSAGARRLGRAALASIEAGGHFSDGLARGGAPALDVAVLRLAEQTGALGDACAHLADYYEYRLKIRSLWLSGLSSPLTALILLLIALLVANYMIHGPAVALTRLLYGLALLGAIAAVVLLVQLLIAGSPLLRRFLSRLSLAVPLFGGIFLNLARGRFFLFLSQLYASGQTPAMCLELAAAACGNASLERRLRRKAAGLVGGGGLSSALRGERILDRDALEILETAEEAGTVDTALLRLSQRYRDEGHRTLERRLPLLARILLIPIVVGLFFLGLMDLAWAMFERIASMLKAHVSQVKLPRP